MKNEANKTNQINIKTLAGANIKMLNYLFAQLC